MGDIAEQLLRDDDERSRSQRGGDGFHFHDYEGLQGYTEMPDALKAEMRKLSNSLKAKVSHLSKVQRRLNNLNDEEKELREQHHDDP